MNLYPEMNETIKDLLRMNDEPMHQYILARIEQLEEKNARLQWELERYKRSEQA